MNRKNRSISRKVAILAGISSILSLPVFAGGETGNGGVGVVCRNNAGKILSAELLDIFEGRSQYRLQYPANSLDLDTQIELVQLKMLANQPFLQGFQSELSKVRANLIFLPSGVGLEPTNDAFPVINKKGCRFEQVANYATDGKIYVDQEIYDHFDHINQAALYVHEATYALARANVGDISSVRSRRLTSQVLAKNTDSGVTQELMSQLMLRPEPVQVDQFNGLWDGTFDAIGARTCSLYIVKGDRGVIYRTFTDTPDDPCPNFWKQQSVSYQCSQGICTLIEPEPFRSCDKVTVVQHDLVEMDCGNMRTLYKRR